VYVIANIAYIHPVYGRIRTHDLLDVSLHHYPLGQTSPHLFTNVLKYSFLVVI
jgi:hypothetical protein